MFGGRSPSDSYHLEIDSCLLEKVKFTKFLGVFIDEKLNWKIHICEMAKKISRNLGMMRKIQHKLETESLVNLYNTMILPHLSYCLIVWGCATDKNINCLFNLQKKLLD